MTNEELASIIDQEVANSVGYYSGKLAEQRKEAMERYLGEPYGNEQEGRSSVVSRDLADTVEWIMPALMKIFTSSDEIVKFDPQGQEDEEGSQQATDYVNHVFQKQNNGFVTLYSFFKDALILKNGFVKTYWEEYTKRKVESYENLTMDELTAMLMQLEEQGFEVNVLEQTEENGLIEVKLELIDTSGKVCVDPVPPDEVLVSKNATWDLQKARFVAHRTRKTASELREMGFSTEGLSYEDVDAFGLERQVRFLADQEDVVEEDAGDESQRNYLVTEAYPLVDFDGDGIAERRIVLKVGKTILSNEEIDRVPLDTITPIIMPHKLYGRSIADLIDDLALIKTTIMRQILDNMYLTNNSRVMALDGMVNIDDLLTVRPGGVVRVKTFDALKPMQVPFFGAPAFNMLGYLDQMREGRTGVRYFQGVDADALNKDVSGVAMDSYKMAAMEKIELIARIFAETGVKSMFWSIFELITKHERKARVVRLRNKWIPIDPRTWSNRYDLSVTVGLGTGNKQQFLNSANLLFNVQKEIVAGVGLGRVVTEGNIYALASDVAETVFPKKADQYFTNPEGLPPPQPQPNPEVEMQREKAQMADKTKRDLGMVNFMKDIATLANQKPEKPDNSMQLERMRADNQKQLKSLDLQGQMQIKEREFEMSEEFKQSQQKVSAIEQMLKQIVQGQEQFAKMLDQSMKLSAAPRQLIEENGEPVGVMILPEGMEPIERRFKMDKAGNPIGI